MLYTPLINFRIRLSSPKGILGEQEMKELSADLAVLIALYFKPLLNRQVRSLGPDSNWDARD